MVEFDVVSLDTSQVPHCASRRQADYKNFFIRMQPDPAGGGTQDSSRDLFEEEQERGVH